MRYYTAKEASQMAGLCVSQVRAAARDMLCGTRIAGRWVFTDSDIEKLKVRHKLGRPRRVDVVDWMDNSLKVVLDCGAERGA